MLTLNDGRSELWQWDTGRKLTVDAECSQVHFSNKVFGRSIDIDVIDGSAIIPDILLQTDKDLNAWAFVGTAENGYTKISKTFKVNRRNKPADYVFTPQEQILLKDAISIVETAKSAANDAIESAKQAEASADKAAQIADDMKKLADQVEQNTEAATQAKADALIAQAKAEAAFASAEAARDAAEDSANSAGTNASAASAAATRAENAANDAAAELDTIRSLYLDMQEYVSHSIQDIQTEGNTQVQRVAEEGAAQIAAAKEQADRADVAKEAAEDAAASAQTVAGAIQAESEQIGKNTVDIAALQIRMSQDAPGIVETAAGETIVLDDSSGRLLQGLRIYGKTTQDGTPTPEAPVELVSVGDSGSVKVTVCGKNLLDTETVTNHYYTADGVMTAHAGFALFDWIPVKHGEILSFSAKYIGSINELLRWAFFDKKKNFISRHTSATAKAEQFVITAPVDGYIRVFLSTDNYDITTAQLTYGNAVSAYETFKGGHLIISTPNGLHGIQVTSGGNYTDADGQQWICDEVDLARGVYVQRIGAIDRYAGEAVSEPYLSTTGALSTGAKVLYVLTTPIEKPIPEDELVSYAALHTNKPNTTIYTDAGAHMEAQYVADTKLYIDKQFAELRNAIVSLGGNV